MNNKENINERSNINLSYLKKLVELSGFIDDSKLPQFNTQEKLYEFCLEIMNEL